MVMTLVFFLTAFGGLILIEAAEKIARRIADNAPPAPEPEPVIDLDLLEAELSMEFHVWKRAA